MFQDILSGLEEAGVLAGERNSGIFRSVLFGVLIPRIGLVLYILGMPSYSGS